MKDYENFMAEEARQDRLQEELENRREEDRWDADEYWQAYKRKQEEDKYQEWLCKSDDCCYQGEFDPDSYVDPDELQDAEDAELFDTWYEHIYDYGFQKYDCSDEQDLLDTDVPGCDTDESLDRRQIENELYELELAGDYDSHFWLSDGWYHDTDELYFENRDEEEQDFEELRRIRKAASRNRHHASKKEKEKAEKSARILEAKFWKLYSDITSHNNSNYFRLSPEFTERDAFLEGKYLSPAEIRRLYYSEKAATKKANRVKVKTA